MEDPQPLQQSESWLCGRGMRNLWPAEVTSQKRTAAGFLDSVWSVGMKYRIGGHFQRHHAPSRSLVEQFLAIAALVRTTKSSDLQVKGVGKILEL